jgi:hypothetical protein
VGLHHAERRLGNAGRRHLGQCLLPGLVRQPLEVECRHRGRGLASDHGGVRSACYRHVPHHAHPGGELCADWGKRPYQPCRQHQRLPPGARSIHGRQNLADSTGPERLGGFHRLSHRLQQHCVRRSFLGRGEGVEPDLSRKPGSARALHGTDPLADIHGSNGLQRRSDLVEHARDRRGTESDLRDYRQQLPGSRIRSGMRAGRGGRQRSHSRLPKSGEF